MIRFLKKRVSSLAYLNLTQFLGALNDNIYKLLLVYFLIGLEGVEQSSTILSISGAVFVIPFLIFSAPSGILADRYSKSTIIFLTKALEVITMGLGVLGFLYESRIGSYVILFLMALQSAIFSPAKFGIIPEIVGIDKVSQANGMISLFTFLAIILGTFFASLLTELSGRNFVLAAMFCLLIALLGLLTSTLIAYTQPAGAEKRITLKVISQIKETFRGIWNEAPAPGVILVSMFGSAYFLLLGSFIQLNLIPYAVETLGMSDVQGGYLFLFTALGIGLGSYLAGKVSGSGVELGLIPIACFGLAWGCFLLDSLSDSPSLVFLLASAVGFAGGLVIVPLDSYIQLASPVNLRGQVIAATNFLSFVGVLFASFSLFFLSNVLGLNPGERFTAMGTVTFCFATLILYQYFDFLARFIGMILSRLHFRTTYEGLDKIPKGPAIYICYHTAWNDTLLFLGAQKRRIRFFIEEVQDHSFFFKRLYYLLGIFHLPNNEPLEKNRPCLIAIRDALKKGMSVSIFINHRDVEGAIEKLKHSYFFQEMIGDLGHPLIPVYIEKDERGEQPKNLFEKLIKKTHWPAYIYFGYKRDTSSI